MNWGKIRGAAIKYAIRKGKQEEGEDFAQFFIEKKLKGAKGEMWQLWIDYLRYEFHEIRKEDWKKDSVYRQFYPFEEFKHAPRFIPEYEHHIKFYKHLLTPRERLVIHYLVMGHNMAATARIMGFSAFTARKTFASVVKKLNAVKKLNKPRPKQWTKPRLPIKKL